MSRNRRLAPTLGPISGGPAQTEEEIVGESYEGRVVIRQQAHAMPAHATIVVNEEGSGWEIALQAEPGAAVGFDRTQLLEVALPGGGSGRFVHWRRSASQSLGIGLGWPPTLARAAR